MDKQTCTTNTCTKNCLLLDFECLNWTDIKTTAMIFATIELLFFSVMLSGISIISVVANFALFSLVAAIAVCYFMEKPAKDDNEYEYISKDKLESVFKSFYSTLICLDEKFKKIVSLESPVCTLQTLGLVYVFTIIASNVCSCFLVFIATNLFFLVPLAYKLQGDNINKLTSKACCVLSKAFTTIESKIPRYQEKEKKN